MLLLYCCWKCYPKKYHYTLFLVENNLFITTSLSNTHYRVFLFLGFWNSLVHCLSHQPGMDTTFENCNKQQRTLSQLKDWFLCINFQGLNSLHTGVFFPFRTSFFSSPISGPCSFLSPYKFPFFIHTLHQYYKVLLHATHKFHHSLFPSCENLQRSQILKFWTHFYTSWFHR